MTSSKVSQLAALMRNSELTGTRKTSQQGNDPVFGALLRQAGISRIFPHGREMRFSPPEQNCPIRQLL